jgi:UDP-N-acetylglucosamine 4,6-dehydratase (inverting)
MKNKTILITGGTGSFGNAFVKYCLEQINPKKIIIYSRDELKQYEMEKRFSNEKKTQLRFFIGDVRDLPRLKLAMNGVDIVIHAAAMKHVPIAEYNPIEAIKTNIIGAQNIVEASLSANIDKVLALSTDKAAAPINLYGATKLASDKLMIAANNFVGKNKNKYSVVRYGNVMASRGSVIPLFYKQSKTGILKVTHKDMTRFNITLQESVQYVFKCLKNMEGGELFVPKLSSYRVIDLAKAISPMSKIKYTGIRPGEKVHEELITTGDAINCKEFKDEYIIFPNSIYIPEKRFKKYKNGKKCLMNFSYASNNNKEFLKISQLKEIIKKNNF